MKKSQVKEKKVLFEEVEVVGRETWGAVELDPRPSELQVPVFHVFLGFTYTKSCAMRSRCHPLLQRIQHDHRHRLHLRDLKYNFLIGGDGRLYEGRGWYSCPVLPMEYHHLTPVSYLLAFIGDFTPSIRRNFPYRHIEENMIEVLNSFIKYGRINGFIGDRFKVNHLYLCEVMSIDIYTRETWKAMPARFKIPLQGPANLIFLVYTYTRPCYSKEECRKAIRRLQELQINIQKKNDIKYNFIIGGDGNIYEGRGWNELPSTPWKYKRAESSFVLGFMGQYSTEEFPPQMKEAAIKLIDHGMAHNLVHPYCVKENQLRKIKVPDFNNISHDYRSEPYNNGNDMR